MADQISPEDRQLPPADQWKVLIALDSLSCLNGLIWLRAQEKVVRKIHLAQSSVSRNAKRCCSTWSAT
jgi:hypothetical protein